MTRTRTSRTDLHCHSTASRTSTLGVQRSLGLPECATPPEEVYALAKRRGMDFVTVTDHDTIDGALELAQRYDDAFVSEELTAWFRGEPQAVHVLVYGIAPEDHEWLQRHRGDVETCVAYLRDQGIVCALAHPFYAVAAPLEPRHRRRLAELFGIWEVRNGARAPELNAPAALYVDTHGGVGIGGSDDHAGVDVGRTWTATPPAATWREFLGHLAGGRATAGGDEGSAEKWAHAAIALTIRALGGAAGQDADPLAVLAVATRLLAEGDARTGPVTADLSPEDARRMVAGWLQAADLGMGPAALLAHMQEDGFSHLALGRHVRRTHELALGRAIDAVEALATAGENPLLGAAGVFEACLPAIPYGASATFLGREKAKLARRAERPLRAALIADGIGSTHGVTRTIAELRERGVPGCQVDVIGTDAEVDHRIRAVREIELAHYPGLTLGVPSLPALVDVLAGGDYDVVHVCAPGPAGAAGALLSRALGLPLVGSYHTDLAAYASVRTGDPALEALALHALGAFYGACDHVLTPSPAADAAVAALGVAPERIGRWDRGVDLARFDPVRRDPALYGTDRINVLYAGRQSLDKGVELLCEAFLAARARDPRLHLWLAGDGPERDALRARLGAHATFLGWLTGEALARAYASADLFLFASRTDTFGQVILEAQASGLAVVAVGEGGPRSIVEDGRTGILCPPLADALAGALGGLAAAPLQRHAMGAAAREAVRGRSWDAALGRLAAGYRAAAGRTGAVRLAA